MKAVAHAREKLAHIREKAIARFGSVCDTTTHGYWREYEYIGPFSDWPNGKFVVDTPLAMAREYAERLLPYVRKNKIAGLKHPIKENPPGHPFHGTSCLIVYTTKRKRHQVEGILKAEGVTGARWTEENPAIAGAHILTEGIRIDRMRHQLGEGTAGP